MNREKILLLRYNNYKKVDFIDAHQSVIVENGFVWMLKIGRKLPVINLQSIVDGSRKIILKAPKKFGGKYYKVDLLDFYNGDALDDFCYPEYYREMLEDDSVWMMDSLSGTWLKVKNFIQLSDNDISKLRLLSNNKLVEDVIKSTRSTVLYVYVSDE